MADNLTPEQRRLNMSRIRSKDTQPETKVRKLVHACGLRYFKHVKSMPGKPDMVFPRARVVVFIDGDFWHGWKFDEWKDKLGTYWRGKIEGNMTRDGKHQSELVSAGWQVVRIWEHEVQADVSACIQRIEQAVRGHQPVASALACEEKATYNVSTDCEDSIS